jgi:hypothetical protein
MEFQEFSSVLAGGAAVLRPSAETLANQWHAKS